MRRWCDKLSVANRGSTSWKLVILSYLSAGEVNGTLYGAVKCDDIWKNTDKAKAVNYSVTDIEAWKRGEQNGLDTRVVHALNDEC